MYNKKSANKFLITLGSPGLSSLTLSLYLYEKMNKTYLVLKFVPCIGQDDMGNDQYCKTTFKSTSIDCAAAKDLYQTTMSILNGPDRDKEIVIPLPSGKDTTLTFEYKPEHDGHMGVYLIINKENLTIPFRFQTVQSKVWNGDGQVETMVTQVGLDVFTQTLDRYLKIIGADNNTNNSPEGFNGF